MVAFRVTDEGTPRILAEKMFDSSKRAMDTEPIIQLIALDMMEITNTQFTSEGRRGGGSWKRLAPSTIRKKGSSQILQDTGKLIDSLTVPGHGLQILNIGFNEIEYGTRRPWAFVHQHGSRDGHVPARPFLRFRVEDEARWRGMLAQWILEPFEVK